MKTRLLCLTLALFCLIGVLPVTAASFSDVADKDWFADSVYAVCDHGYMIGTAPDTFSPAALITGAEGVTLLARIHADTQGTTDTLAAFTEASSPWYAGYINYCAAAGLLNEQSAAVLDATLEAPMTRAELLYVLSALPDTLFSAKNTVEDGTIPDVDTDAYYAPAVYRAYRAGITVGVDNAGTFRPDAQISRAEVAAILVRIAEPARRQSVTLTFDLETAMNRMALTPCKTGYTVLDNMVDRVLAAVITDGMTTYDMVTACYDYLVENASYGRSPASGGYRPIYKKNPYHDPAPDLITSPAKPLVGDHGYEYFYIALKEHALEGYTAMYASEMLDSLTGWCDHYSSAFAILCRRIGLECIPVYVNSRLGNEYKPHMTAVIRVGGVDCIFDPQIEAVLVGNTGKNEHKRFCRPIDEMTEEYRDWDDLEQCRELMGTFAYDEAKMKAVNAG